MSVNNRDEKSEMPTHSFIDDKPKVQQNDQLEQEHHDLNNQSQQIKMVKKQIEFKQGQVTSILSDLPLNTNHVNQTAFIMHLAVILKYTLQELVSLQNLNNFVIIALVGYFGESNTSVSMKFPIVALILNLLLVLTPKLQSTFNLIKITRQINNQQVEVIKFTKKNARFQKVAQASLKVGDIIKVHIQEEFPADCLILDNKSMVLVDQLILVTSSPSDATPGSTMKLSFPPTASKGSSAYNHETIAGNLTGTLKVQYKPDSGSIQGSFKLSEIPQAIDFNEMNVVRRASKLVVGKYAICLVLNVGNQVMESPFNNQNIAIPGVKIKNQRDIQQNAERRSIMRWKFFVKMNYGYYLGQVFLALFIALFLKFINSQPIFSKIYGFENYIDQGLSDQNEVQLQRIGGICLLILSVMHSSSYTILNFLGFVFDFFIQKDIDLVPCSILFQRQNCSYSLARISHLMMSRRALQNDNMKQIKLIQLESGTFINLQEDSQNIIDENDVEKLFDQKETNNRVNLDDNIMFDHLNSDSDSDNEEVRNENMQNDYFPNATQLNSPFFNQEFQKIIKDPEHQVHPQIKSLLQGILAGVTSKQQNDIKDTYICFSPENIQSLYLAKQYGFEIMHKDTKMLTTNNQGVIKKFQFVAQQMVDSVTLTIIQEVPQGTSTLYVQGSVGDVLKHFDHQHLNTYNLKQEYDKLIQVGLHSVVYLKRHVEDYEEEEARNVSNQYGNVPGDPNIIATIMKISKSKQLQQIGIIGIKNEVNLRNTLTIEDMLWNNIKVWIVSQENEVSHNINLRSLQIVNEDSQLLKINGVSEQRIITQIYKHFDTITAQKTVISKKVNNQGEIKKVNQEDTESRINFLKRNSQLLKRISFTVEIPQVYMARSCKRKNRILEISPQSLQMIMRDQKLQKMVFTLSMFCDVTLCSGVMPKAKQKLAHQLHQFLSQEEMQLACTISTEEDHYLMNTGDIVINLRNCMKSNIYKALCDIDIFGVYALSYIFFRHGNSITNKMLQVYKGFFYKILILMLITLTHMTRSCLTDRLPYEFNTYLAISLVFFPLQVFLSSIYLKQYCQQYHHRIFGQYFYNKNTNLFQMSELKTDILYAFYDFLIIYLPMNVISHKSQISVQDGKVVSYEAQQVYEAITLQIYFYVYLLCSNHIVVKEYFLLTTVLLVVGVTISCLLQMNGAYELGQTPHMLFMIVFQLLMLLLKYSMFNSINFMASSDRGQILNWYMDVEKRLAFEDYEEPNQFIDLNSMETVYNKACLEYDQQILRLANRNLSQCQGIDEVDLIQQKIARYYNQGQEHGSNDQQKRESQAKQMNRDQNIQREYKQFKAQAKRSLKESQLILLLYCITQLMFFVVISLQQDQLLAIVEKKIELHEEDIEDGHEEAHDELSALELRFFNLVNFLAGSILLLVTRYQPKISKYLTPLFILFILLGQLNYNYIMHQSNNSANLLVLIVLSAYLLSNDMTVFIAIISVYSIFELILSYQNIQLLSVQGALPYRIHVVNFISRLGLLILWLYHYKQESHNQFLIFTQQYLSVRRLKKYGLLLKQLVPAIHQKMEQMSVRSQKSLSNHFNNEGEVSVIWIEIKNLHDIIHLQQTKQAMKLIQQIYTTVDLLSAQLGVQKMQSKSDQFLLCAGMKIADQRLDQLLLNKHHSVRASEFCMKLKVALSEKNLNSGVRLHICQSIHIGNAFSGVIGDYKQSVCLSGEVVNISQHINNYQNWKSSNEDVQDQIKCKQFIGNMVVVSQQLKDKLEIHSNQFKYVNITPNKMDSEAIQNQKLNFHINCIGISPDKDTEDKMIYKNHHINYSQDIYKLEIQLLKKQDQAQEQTQSKVKQIKSKMREQIEKLLSPTKPRVINSKSIKK